MDWQLFRQRDDAHPDWSNPDGSGIMDQSTSLRVRERILGKTRAGRFFLSTKVLL